VASLRASDWAGALILAPSWLAWKTFTPATLKLYYVHPQGYGEAVPWRCSGPGTDYVHALAKFLLLPKLSLEESALRAAFIIWWVEDLNTTVGGPPQVAMIRNRPSVLLSGQAVATVEYLSSENLEWASKLANRKKRALPGLMFR
jgi:hypothetical protein